jgi:N-acetylmuramoyl-L-alanine amidase
MRGRRWAWPLAILVFFLAGIAGGWVLSDPGNGNEAKLSVPAHRSELSRRIKQAEEEVEAAQKKVAARGPGAPVSAPASGENGTTLAGVTITVDPGHNGGNADHPEEISQPVVAAADGSTKACNTTGTQTSDGALTEAEFNLDVADDLKRELDRLGARVVMTRRTNDGVGPCINERAEIANKAEATALISIHADGNEAEGARGFHVIHALPDQMVVPSLARPSLFLAKAIRNALVAAGVPASNYVGENGLDARDDIGGLNLARVPAVLVELGNMRSLEEASKLETKPYRRKLARALAVGVQRFLEEAQF